MSRFTCWIVSETMSAYSDGELSNSERLAIEKHLASCHACSHAAARMANVTRLVDTAAQSPPDRDAVIDLKRRVMESVLATSPEEPQRVPFGDMLRDLMSEPVAASVAITFGVLLGVLRVML